ncbi:hypothetical protein CLOM_g2017 [Closterium sp. NIES-68]|nr:hypothetical protein CLOM_g2017 [Closterium sp. NIES-68]GJP62631.1 hypothetical protein CLOP_g19667 [Closterium sp. NIES-67]
MEDLTRNYKLPCIMDIKMGRKTWYQGAPQKYIDKCLVKDATTTSGTLGYRIAGMQVHDSSTDAMWRADRKWCQNLTNQQMPAVFRLFFSLTPTADAPAIDAIAAGSAAGDGTSDAAATASGDVSAAAKERMRSVLCGEGGLLAQLQTLRDWFAQQTTFHFFSASILLIYEAPTGSTQGHPPSLRLVDFAHAIDGHGEIDSNFLEAIDGVVVALNGLLAEEQVAEQ